MSTFGNRRMTTVVLDAINSAIDTVRALSLDIDPPLEGLMDAHGFSFANMTATEGGVRALFHGCSTGGDSRWQLTLERTADSPPKVALERVGDRPAMSLQVVVGTGGIDTLSQAVGLAVSCAALADQMAAGARL